MESQPENGPTYAERGSKITVDPAVNVREQGVSRGLATCNSSGVVCSRAILDGQTATGDSSGLVNSQAILGEHTATGYMSVNYKVKRKKVIYEVNETPDGYEIKNCKDQRTGNKCTQACSKTRCGTCAYINNQKEVISSTTGYGIKLQYDCTCETKNVVYLLSCKKCGMQYVGETKRSLRQRFGEHKNSVKKNVLNTLLVKHFNLNGHTYDDMTILVLHTIDEGEYGKSKHTLCEDYYIRLLNTAYPFGLNDKIKGYGCATEICNPTLHKAQPYFCTKFKRKKRSRGMTRNRRRARRNGLFIEEMHKLYSKRHNTDGIRSVVAYLRKQNLKTLYYHFRAIGDTGSKLNGEMQLLLLGYMSGYYQQLSGKKGENKDNRYRLTVDFPNKGVEQIGLSNIFLDKKLNSIIPEVKRKDLQKVSIVYKYDEPISKRLFNYNKVLRGIKSTGVDIFLKGSCQCQESAFQYKPFKHVVTGNLEIIQNIKLREIFSKGSKYRLPVRIDWEQVECAAAKAVIRYGNHLHRKYKIDFGIINDYIDRFMYIVKSRIGLGKRLHDNAPPNDCILPFNELKRLQNKYVITMADKAAGNFVFICKKFYVEVICKELGVTGDAGSGQTVGNDTYKLVNKPLNVLLKEHEVLVSKYSLENIVKEEHKKELPLLFATPKLHKNPFGFRFIAGARFSTIRTVNILLHKVLGHIKRHFERYCIAIEKNTGYKYFWSVTNSHQVVEYLEARQRKGKIKQLVTCDFSTLFTKLPHYIIKSCLYQLIEMCYKNSGKRYIIVKRNFSCYSNDVSEEANSVSLSKEDVFEIIEVVLAETYVQFGAKIFKQICGVPMGGNASTLISDLTLSMMEYRYITDCVRDKKQVPEGKRYIDDLAIVNCAKFMEIAKDIYPVQLVLNRTNSNDNEGTYLDLSIILADSVQLRIYNKTDAFGFDIVRYGFESSNVHSSMGSGIFYSQLTRFIKITNNAKDFELRVLNMFQIFLSHGFQRSRLLSKFLLFVQNNKARIGWLGFSSNLEIAQLVGRIFHR